MWSAATCHWRERHHEARIGLRTALESTASAERNRTLASARRSRDVCGGVDACAIFASPPNVLRLEAQPGLEAQPARIGFGFTCPLQSKPVVAGHCLKLRPPIWRS